MKRPLPIGERELWACAQKVIDKHGADAEWHAAQSANELLDSGDVESQRVWQTILLRIAKLRDPALPPLLR